MANGDRIMNDSLGGLMTELTGGYPINELIVTKDENGDPHVFAFFPDVERDVYRVTYEGDETVRFHPNGDRYMLFEPETLFLIVDFSSDAELIWDEINAPANSGIDEYGNFDHLVTHQHIAVQADDNE